MENSSEAIELSVGVILFIIAITIAIALFSNINKVTKNLLSVSNTNANIVVDQEVEETTKNVYYRSDVVAVMYEILLHNVPTDPNYDPTPNLYTSTTEYPITFILENEVLTQTNLEDKLESYMKNVKKDEEYAIDYTFTYVDGDAVSSNMHKVKTLHIRKLSAGETENGNGNGSGNVTTTYNNWVSNNFTYILGDTIRYNGKNYICTLTHTTNGDMNWAPNVMHALWREM